MTLPIDADGNVPIAGLRVPLPLVPRIVAAVRGLYPTVAEGLDNDAAIRAWLKHITSVTLAQWEAQQAAAGVTQAVEETRAEYALAADTARQNALADAAAIVEAPQLEA